MAADGPVTVVDLDQAKAELGELLDRAARGERIVIARDGGHYLVELTRIAQSGERRTPAGALGITYIAEDFDAPRA